MNYDQALEAMRGGAFVRHSGWYKGLALHIPDGASEPKYYGMDHEWKHAGGTEDWELCKLLGVHGNGEPDFAPMDSDRQFRSLRPVYGVTTWVEDAA